MPLRYTPLLIILMLASGLSGVLAQDSATADTAYNAPDGSFSFMYPGTWAIGEIPGAVLMANTAEALDRFGTGGDLLSGEIFAVMAGPGFFTGLLGASADSTLHDMADQLRVLLGGEPNMPPLGAPFELDFEGRQAVIGMTETPTGSTQATYLIIDHGEAQFLGIVVIVAVGEGSIWEPLIIEMVRSLRLGTTGALERASVNWVAPDLLLNMAGDLAVIDDRIYVADGIDGIVVLSLEGEPLERLRVEGVSVVSGIGTAADGENLWVMSAFSNAPGLHLIDTEGAVLHSITGSAFDGKVLYDMAVATDGLIYIYHNAPADSVFQYRIMGIQPGDGAVASEFDLPSDLYAAQMDVGPDGSIYLASTSGIMIMNPVTGEVEDSLWEGRLMTSMVTGFAVIPDGSMFIGVTMFDSFERIIWHIDGEGAVLGRFTADQLQSNDLETFYRPLDFALLDDGTLIVSDASAEGSAIFSLTLAPGSAE